MGIRVEVGKEGRITIPKSVRDSLGIKEGDVLVLTVVGRKIVLEPERRVDVREVARKLDEHGKRVSYAKRASLGELEAVSLEEEFEDDLSGR
ncbi:MAG: AbrB/MazE/SpoVT family DNA-binding domain-containing protein [Thermoprotei archaeon]